MLRSMTARSPTACNNMIRSLKHQIVLLAIVSACNAFDVCAQQSSAALSLDLSVSRTVAASCASSGRLFLFLSEDAVGEPRTDLGPSQGHHIFARNIVGLDADKGVQLSDAGAWTGTPEWSLDNIPKGTYSVQLLWDQDTLGSSPNEAGNLHSRSERITLKGPTVLSLSLDQVIPERTIVDHPLMREVSLRSDTLSTWWGRDVVLQDPRLDGRQGRILLGLCSAELARLFTKHEGSSLGCTFHLFTHGRSL